MTEMDRVQIHRGPEQSTEKFLHSQLRRQLGRRTVLLSLLLKRLRKWVLVSKILGKFKEISLSLLSSMAVRGRI